MKFVELIKVEKYQEWKVKTGVSVVETIDKEFLWGYVWGLVERGPFSPRLRSRSGHRVTGPSLKSCPVVVDVQQYIIWGPHRVLCQGVSPSFRGVFFEEK